MRRSPLLFLTLSLLLISIYPISTVIAGCDPNAPITRISVASDGTQGNGSSSSGDISSDGNYVVFQSFASNLVANDGNQSADIFVYNRQTCTTTRVSINPNGMEFSGDSWSPSISSNGDYVAFHTGGQVYIHSRVTNTTSLVSSALNAAPGNAESVYASVNGNGESVAFESVSTDLVNGDTNNASDIFIRDQQMTRVSVSSNGIEGNGLGASLPSVSDDGRYIVFHAFSNNLVVNDSNNVSDIFVHDRQLSTTRRISVSTNGTQGNGTSLYGSISGNGRYIAFYSEADNLVVGDTNDKPDIFIHDVQTGVTSRISISSSGEQSNDGSIGSSLSHDGHFVAFSSSATNIITGDTNNSCDLDGDLIFAENCPDAFIHNRQTGQTIRISVGLGGIQGNLATQSPVVSSNGQFAVFSSNASNLVAGDTNGTADVFLVSVVFPSLPVFSVTKTADTNDGTCDADCSLREAITAANANPSSTVNIPAGTYTITRTGADEDNNTTGDFDINAIMTITGAGASTTIIDGNDLDRIFHITGNFSVNISGVTVRNGYLADNVAGAGILNPTGRLNLNAVVVTENSALFGQGGGISCDDGSSLSITDSTISYNTARFFGGGIQCMGTITILNSILTFNETTDAGFPGGGAIYHYTLQDSPLTITSSTISNNTAADIGGVYSFVDTGNSLTLTDSIVSNNTGGVFIFGGSITNTTFSGNNSTRPGGAVFVGDGVGTITDSIFENNTSTVGGGAVAIEVGAITNITDSSFTNNSAEDGGSALFIKGGLTLSGSTLSNNTVPTASEYGGAIFIDADGSATIQDSTFDNNASSYGGAIWNYSQQANALEIFRSTFSNHTTGAVNTNGGTITDSTFLNNTTTFYGAAISSYDSLTISRSLFVNNIGDSVLGIGAVWLQHGDNQILNSTFSGNSGFRGGAVYVGNDQSAPNEPRTNLTITHSTLSSNTVSDVGGGIYAAYNADVILRANILNVNAGGNCALSVTPGGIITSTGYNISSDASCNPYFTAIGDLNNTNPLLAALANNGGLTQTMALLAGSPALNRVPSANCTLSVDQRGFVRPVGSGCDSGAYESNSTPAPLPSEAPQRNYFTTSTPTLTWSRVTTAASYIIEVDTDRNFTAPFAFRATGVTTTSITTTSLTDGTYYWRVRMVNASGVPGMWSLIDSFVVDVP